MNKKQNNLEEEIGLVSVDDEVKKLVIFQHGILDYREDVKSITRDKIMERFTCMDEFEGSLTEYELMTGRKFEFMSGQGRPTRRTFLKAAFNPVGDFYYRTRGRSFKGQLNQLQISEYLVNCLLDSCCYALIHVRRMSVGIENPRFPGEQDIYVSGIPIKW